MEGADLGRVWTSFEDAARDRERAGGEGRGCRDRGGARGDRTGFAERIAP